MFVKSLKRRSIFILLFLFMVGTLWSAPVEAAKPKVTFEWLVEPTLYRATLFTQDVVWIQEKQGQDWKLIGKDGRTILPHFSAYTVRSYGIKVPLAPFEDNNRRAGYIDFSGNIAIAPEYRFTSTFWNNVAVVTKLVGNDKLQRGVINSKGEIVLPVIYESVWIFQDDLFAVKKDGKWGYMNDKGETIIDFIYDAPSHAVLPPDICMGAIDGKIGLLNRKGEWILPAVYDAVYQGREGLIGLLKNGKVGFVDTEGNTVIDFQFMKARGKTGGVLYSFSEGLAVVLFSKLPEYPAPIKREKISCGVIDKTGKVLFKFKGLPSSLFINGLLVVQRSEKTYELMDRSGNSYSLPPLPSGLEYDDVFLQEDISDRILLVKAKEKEGLHPKTLCGYLKVLITE